MVMGGAMARSLQILCVTLLVMHPLLASAQNVAEYKSRCSAGYIGPLAPGEKPELAEVPSRTCSEWIEPDLTPKFKKFYPSTEYAFSNVMGRDESAVVVTFSVKPLNDSKNMSASITTVIRKSGKWKGMHEVALQSRVALQNSVKELMGVCERSARCDIFKMPDMSFSQTIQGEQ